jgi:hypothetical protein
VQDFWWRSRWWWAVASPSPTASTAPAGAAANPPAVATSAPQATGAGPATTVTTSNAAAGPAAGAATAQFGPKFQALLDEAKQGDGHLRAGMDAYSPEFIRGSRSRSRRPISTWWSSIGRSRSTDEGRTPDRQEVALHLVRRAARWRERHDVGETRQQQVKLLTIVGRPD